MTFFSPFTLFALFALFTLLPCHRFNHFNPFTLSHLSHLSHLSILSILSILSHLHPFTLALALALAYLEKRRQEEKARPPKREKAAPTKAAPRQKTKWRQQRHLVEGWEEKQHRLQIGEEGNTMRGLRPSLASPSLQAALLSRLLRSGATPEGEWRTTTPPKRTTWENNNIQQRGKQHAKRRKAATPRKSKESRTTQSRLRPSLLWACVAIPLFSFGWWCFHHHTLSVGAADLPSPFCVVLLFSRGWCFLLLPPCGWCGFFLFAKTKQKHTHKNNNNNNKRNELPKHYLTSKSSYDYCQKQ